MPYADTDFFIALMDESDRLNKAAEAKYHQYRGSIHTSLAVAIEVTLVAKRKGRSVEKTIAALVSIARLIDTEENKVLMAAHLIEKFGIGVFDAFHAALCDGEIISSDSVYDSINSIRRIKLE